MLHRRGSIEHGAAPPACLTSGLEVRGRFFAAIRLNVAISLLE
jgi:hypothetical protein